jgi:hypothetical protein
MKVIRIALTMCVVIGFVNYASAQIAVGPKGGINFNSFRGNEAYDVIPAFNVGGFVKYPFFPFLSARGEVLYMQQAANLIDYRVLTPDLARIHAKVRFHNIQIPLLAEFGLPSLNEDDLQPKLWVGGFYSYTFYARESYTNVAKITGYDRVEYEGHRDFTGLINRSQFGLIGALGADVKIKSIPFSIEFRYQYNLNKVNKSGTQQLLNMKSTHDKWGNDLNLSTLSINVAATLFYF